MAYEVAVTETLIASWGALSAAVTVAARRGTRLRGRAQPTSADAAEPAAADDPFSAAGIDPAADAFHAAFGDEFAAEFGALDEHRRLDGPSFDSPRFDSPRFDSPRFDSPRFDAETQSALAACVFAAAPPDHVWWTIMVIDPALRDTPSHIRLVGHFETEFAAVDAADHLAPELNECLVPGEAPLTATAVGIEPEAETSDRTGADRPAPSRIRRAGPVSPDGEPIPYGTSVDRLAHGGPYRHA